MATRLTLTCSDPATLPAGRVTPDDIVAVVGGSHSAILVLMNLLSLNPGPKVVNLHRSPLRYAEFRNGGPPHGYIVRDNTGLKACQLKSSSTPAHIVVLESVVSTCTARPCDTQSLGTAGHPMATLSGTTPASSHTCLTALTTTAALTWLVAAPEIRRTQEWRAALHIIRDNTSLKACQRAPASTLALCVHCVVLHRLPLRYAELNAGPPHGYIVRDNIGLKACQHASFIPPAFAWLWAGPQRWQISSSLQAMAWLAAWLAGTAMQCLSAVVHQAHAVHRHL